jgi:hypothetical protein
VKDEESQPRSWARTPPDLALQRTACAEDGLDGKLEVHERWDFRDGLRTFVRHPDVGAVRGDGVGFIEVVARATDDLEWGAGLGGEVGDRLPTVGRHPDAVATRGDSVGAVEPRSASRGLPSRNPPAGIDVAAPRAHTHDLFGPATAVTSG